MKKSIIVLLVMALVASFAFAAEPTFSGSVTTSMSYDFDGNHDYGFNAEAARPSTTAQFKFSFDKISLTKGSTGENKPYAEIEGTATVKADDVVLQQGVAGKPNVTSVSSAFTLKLEAKITKANIVGESWTLDLLKAVAGSDYAKAAIDLTKDSDKKMVGLDYVYGYDKAAGVTLTLDKYGKVAVGLTGDKNGVNASVFAETAADLLKFDDFAFQAAGTYTTKAVAGGQDNKVGASVKGAYTAEKLSASVAADFGKDGDFMADAAANVAYAQDEFSVTADAYYATAATAVDTKTEAVIRTEYNYLGAQVVTDITAAKTDVTVQAFDLLNDPAKIGGAKGKKTVNVIAHTTIVENLDLTVSGLDLVNDAREVSVEATYTGIENVELGAYGLELIHTQDLGVDVVYTGLENITLAGGVEYVIADKDFGVYAQVDYAADLFDCYARAEFAKTFGVDGANLGVSCGVSSTKLVDNATLSLTYAALDADGLTTNDVLNSSYGKVVAACTVKF